MRVRLAACGLAVAFLLAVAPMANADSWTLALQPPSGAISGTPGATIGWGYSITNLSTTSWLVLTGLSADPFLNATPDASLFAFPIVAPGATLSVLYNPATVEGLFQITWDATAPIGFTNIGVFLLSGEFWDNDPFAGGNFVALALDQSASYSATVTQPAGARVPEPGTLVLLASGLAGLLFRRRALNRTRGRLRARCGPDRDGDGARAQSRAFNS